MKAKQNKSDIHKEQRLMLENENQEKIIARKRGELEAFNKAENRVNAEGYQNNLTESVYTIKEKVHIARTLNKQREIDNVHKGKQLNQLSKKGFRTKESERIAELKDLQMFHDRNLEMANAQKERNEGGFGKDEAKLQKLQDSFDDLSIENSGERIQVDRHKNYKSMQMKGMELKKTGERSEKNHVGFVMMMQKKVDSLKNQNSRLADRLLGCEDRMEVQEAKFDKYQKYYNKLKQVTEDDDQQTQFSMSDTTNVINHVLANKSAYGTSTINVGKNGDSTRQSSREPDKTPKEISEHQERQSLLNKYRRSSVKPDLPVIDSENERPITDKLAKKESQVGLGTENVHYIFSYKKKLGMEEDEFEFVERTEDGNNTHRTKDPEPIEENFDYNDFENQNTNKKSNREGDVSQDHNTSRNDKTNKTQSQARNSNRKGDISQDNNTSRNNKTNKTQSQARSSESRHNSINDNNIKKSIEASINETVNKNQTQKSKVTTENNSNVLEDSTRQEQADLFKKKNTTEKFGFGEENNSQGEEDSQGKQPEKSYSRIATKKSENSKFEEDDDLRELADNVLENNDPNQKFSRNGTKKSEKSKDLTDFFEGDNSLDKSKGEKKESSRNKSVSFVKGNSDGENKDNTGNVDSELDKGTRELEDMGNDYKPDNSNDNKDLEDLQNDKTDNAEFPQNDSTNNDKDLYMESEGKKSEFNSNENKFADMSKSNKNENSNDINLDFQDGFGKSSGKNKVEKLANDPPVRRSTQKKPDEPLNYDFLERKDTMRKSEPKNNDESDPFKDDDDDLELPGDNKSIIDEQNPQGKLQAIDREDDLKNDVSDEIEDW